MDKYFLILAAMVLLVACGNSKSDPGYDPAVKSACRPIIAPPLMAPLEEAATTTDDTLLSDEDTDDDYWAQYEQKVTLIAQEAHHLVFMFTTLVQCGDDLVYSTMTEIEDADPTTVIVRFKVVDTMPNGEAICSCQTDFTITVDDAEHNLSLVKSVLVISASGTEKTFKF